LAFRGATTGTYTATLKPNGELVLAMADMAVIEQLTPGIIAERRSRWSASRLRVADMNLPMPALVELIEDSLHRSATLVCVAVSEPKLKRLPLSLKGISVLILNRGELGARVGCRLESMGAIEEACRTVLNQGLESLVVTMDKDGVFCCSAKGRPRHLKAPKARIVDVTGAGDAFSSGVVAALASHPEDLVRACNIGQHLAAVTLESHASVSPRLSPTFLKECEAAYPPAKQ
jgi:pseudouridine kinase